MATVLAPCRILRRSLALGPTQVRCDLSSLASGESEGSSQVSPLVRVTVSRVSVAAAMPSFSLHRAVQRLVEVVEDVVEVFDPDADAHEARQHAAGEQLLLAELRVGGGRGMDDERLRIPDIGQVARQVHALDEALPDRSTGCRPA